MRVNECSATNESYEVFIFSEIEEWIRFASFVTEVVFIVLVNAFTLATFATNHQLRKRSTYLIINLTVADLLFGTTEGLLSILEPAITGVEGTNVITGHKCNKVKTCKR